MTKLSVAVISFPGSNRELDAVLALKTAGFDKVKIIHSKHATNEIFDLIVLPGGYSYGDYLRPGALASMEPIIASVAQHEAKGRYIIGICNGFQLLLEAKILPGALIVNKSRRFICKYINCIVKNNDTVFSRGYKKNEVIALPISHFDGCYFQEKKGLQDLKDNNQIILQYCDVSGSVNEEINANGSSFNIAGICNRERNVFGLMPHPENAIAKDNTDGLIIFNTLLKTLS